MFPSFPFFDWKVKLKRLLFLLSALRMVMKFKKILAWFLKRVISWPCPLISSDSQQLHTNTLIEVHLYSNRLISSTSEGVVVCPTTKTGKEWRALIVYEFIVLCWAFSFSYVRMSVKGNMGNMWGQRCERKPSRPSHLYTISFNVTGAHTESTLMTVRAPRRVLQVFCVTIK